MEHGDWAHGPFGLYAQRQRVAGYQRMVLVVVRTAADSTRLAGVVPLLAGDSSVQVVFTHAPPASITGGVREHLSRPGGPVVSWRQATQMRFDLALAASDGLLESVHAPLMKLPHGVGCDRRIGQGRTIASAIVLPTRRYAERLRRSCPEAARTVVVAGDPCFDLIAASVPHREAYRRALGVGERVLVAVSSTRGPGLLAKLLGQLPPHRYLAAAVLPAEEGWQALLAAADVVIGDNGSTTCYAAGAGIPVLLTSRGKSEPGSPVAALAKIAPRLRPDTPYAEQIEHATSAWRPERHDQIRALVTDVPGQSARLIRSAMYRLMRLPEPDHPARTRPVPVPHVPAAAGPPHSPAEAIVKVAAQGG